MEAKEIVVLFEQSKRDKGAVTKHTIKYDAVAEDTKTRTIYIGQQELMRTFGKFPERIIVHVLDGDVQPVGSGG